MQSEPQRPNSAQVRDRVARVRVWGLFDMFDHDIPLNLGSRITVMHGPNGVGKTVVLRMIHELLSGEPDVLLRVPYQQFELEFTSGDRISVQRDTSAKNVDATNHLKCQVVLSSKQHEAPLLIGPDSTVVRRITARLGQPWGYIGDGRWEDPRDGEIIDAGNVNERFGVPAHWVEKLKGKTSDVLQKIRRKCKVLLIGTDRLVSKIRDESDISDLRYQHSLLRRRYPVEREEKRIVEYSRDLLRRFREEHARYGALTERLDRSFVRRLLRREYPKKNPKELLALFKELDDKRRVLTALGLLTQHEDVLGEGAGDAAVLELVSQSTDVFSLYVYDMQEKLAHFDQLQRRLQILRGRTDQTFQFKKLIIDPTEGFMFNSASGSKIDPADLSSGEQHEMVLFYYLLFMAGDDDLVLIDEPEISLHVEWQMAFVEDIKAALRESSIDVLMATHAPAIAQGSEGDDVPLGYLKG